MTDEKILQWHAYIKQFFDDVEIDQEVLEKIRQNNYMCLCKFRTPCPCPESLDEVRRYGRCKCSLYYRPSMVRRGHARGLRLRLSRNVTKTKKNLEKQSN